MAPVRVRNGAGWEGEVEAAWLRPVIKSPREIKTLRVRLEDLHYLLFMKPDGIERVFDLGDFVIFTPDYPLASAYIEWGVEQGYPNRPTCASRQWWWDVGTPPLSNFLWTMTYRERFFVAKNNIAFVDARLYDIFCSEEIGAFLNTTFCLFWMELQARGYGGGGGPVDVKVYEVNEIRVPLLLSKPNPNFVRIFNRLSQVRSIFEELGFALCRERRCSHPEHPYEHVRPETLTLEQVRRASPDRFELDRVVFDVLGLTDEERREVYRAVAQLVKDRLVKARSV